MALLAHDRRTRGRVARLVGLRRIDGTPWGTTPGDRLRTARAYDGRARAGLRRLVREWPPYSPSAINAWLLLVTTKPPTWRDPLSVWPDAPPTLGEPHPGFFYPDPLGFWSEVRRWAHVLVSLAEPRWSVADALSVTALLHQGDHSERLDMVTGVCRPRVVLFLDEAALAVSGATVRSTDHQIVDPYRPGTVYRGFWGRTDDGVVIGKSPQHPSANRFYRDDDMTAFLRSAPI
jgi:hypothetical protein